jgi:hypothetical protein
MDSFIYCSKGNNVFVLRPPDPDRDPPGGEMFFSGGKRAILLLQIDDTSVESREILACRVPDSGRHKAEHRDQPPKAIDALPSILP